MSVDLSIKRFEEYHRQLRRDLAQGRRIFSTFKSCASCAWWEPSHRHEHDGECHRYPRTQETLMVNFCGEHMPVPDYSAALEEEQKAREQLEREERAAAKPDVVGDRAAHSVASIIDDLGGNAALTEALGLSASAVSEMRRRESIPARHWGEVLRFAHGQGIVSVTAERLIRAHDKPSEAA